MPPQFPIIVIADDLSGAAEVAAIAAARGLTAEVHRQFDPTSRAQVIAIDTDSRSLPADQAAGVVRNSTAQFSVNHAHIFKKTDSVLRGHPRAEIEALLDALKIPRAIFIPANPTRGRTITGGKYLISGTPLDQTHFAHDEEFPRRSADVKELLGPVGNCSIHVGEIVNNVPKSGIIIPDADSATDLERFATLINDSTLPAGAADFFSTFLDHWCNSPTQQAQNSALLPISRPALLICGSLAAWRDRAQQCLAENMAVVRAQSSTSIESAAAHLHQTGLLVLATQAEPLSPEQRQPFLAALAKTSASLIQAAHPASLLIEGGATAEAIAKELKWQKFSVQPHAASGVGMLTPLDVPSAPLLLIKPGSYPWPPGIWQSFIRP